MALFVVLMLVALLAPCATGGAPQTRRKRK